MQVVAQIVLFSVIGGLAMDCGNNGSISLNSCQSNPNIRIEKVRVERGGRGGGEEDPPNRYRLSLNTQNTQNTWWAPPEDNWIKCGDLCDTCESLPGIFKNECNNQCEERVDRFLNSFCASATPTTHMSTVTDRQTITSTQTVISTSTAKETETVSSSCSRDSSNTRISTVTQRETVVSTTTTTSITTTTEQNLITITNVQNTILYSTIASTTTEMVTVTPSLPTTTIVSTAVVTVSPTCTPCNGNNDGQLSQTTITTTAYLPGVQSDPAKTQAPTIALGSLIGVFIIALTAVIIGWVWTCWTIKKRDRMDTSSKNKVVTRNTNGDERFFKNPIYEDTSTMPNLTNGSVNDEAPENVNSSAIMYSTISENGEEEGPAYDVLNRAQAIDHRRGRVVANFPGGEDYSRLGLCDDDADNNYQLLDEESLGSKVKN